MFDKGILDRVVTVRELSDELRVSVGLLYRLVGECRVPFFRVGRSIRFNLLDVLLELGVVSGGGDVMVKDEGKVGCRVWDVSSKDEGCDVCSGCGCRDFVFLHLTHRKDGSGLIDIGKKCKGCGFILRKVVKDKDC